MSGEPSQLPRSFGRYELLRRLGAGGMGTVYIALQRTDLAGERLCVVKTIKRAGSELGSRFLDEARTSLQLRHRNICVTYDVILEDGATAIAMELIAGRDLKKIWGCGAAPTAVVAALGCFVLDGLSYAHALRDQRTGAALNLVHRDLSPHNIMVSFEGDVKIIDFGVAASALKTSETVIGDFVGKIRYAAPEQLLGTGIDGRTDVYALAIVLAELASGARFYGDAPDDIVLDIVGRGAPFVSPALDDVDARLRAVLEAALAREAHGRVTAPEMRDALVRVVGGEPSVQRMRAWLNDLFPGAAAAHDELVRSLLAGEAAEATSSLSAGERVDPGAPTVVGRAPSAPRAAAERSGSRTAPTRTARPRSHPEPGERAPPQPDARQQARHAETVVAVAPDDPTTLPARAGRGSDVTASLMLPPSSSSAPPPRAPPVATAEIAVERGAGERASSPLVAAVVAGVVVGGAILVGLAVMLGPASREGADGQQVDARGRDARARIDASAPGARLDEVEVAASDAGAVRANAELMDAGEPAVVVAANVDAGDAGVTGATNAATNAASAGVDVEAPGNAARSRPKQPAQRARSLPARPALAGQKVRYLEAHCAKLTCAKRLVAAAAELAAKPHDDVRAFTVELDRCLDLCGAPR